MRIKRLARRLRSLIAPRRPAPLILAYHRIARPRVDPWRLSVSPERFRQQLRSIKASRLPMSMSEVAARIEARDLPPTAVALTFDDGYRDNLLVAKPILVEEEVPATIFLSTGAIDARCEFWWDELARLVLDRQASADCQVPLPGGPLHLRLPAVPAGWQGDDWHDGKAAASPRARAHLQLWTRLRDRSIEDRDTDLAAIRAALGDVATDESGLPVTTRQVQELAVPGLVEIGAHGVAHLPLTTVAPDRRRTEIFGSKLRCEQLLGHPVSGFTYPHGDTDEETRAMVREAGFAYACTTDPSAIEQDRVDLYALPRVQALDWSADQIMAAFARHGTKRHGR